MLNFWLRKNCWAQTTTNWKVILVADINLFIEPRAVTKVAVQIQSILGETSKTLNGSISYLNLNSPSHSIYLISSNRLYLI